MALLCRGLTDLAGDGAGAGASERGVLQHGLQQLRASAALGAGLSDLLGDAETAGAAIEMPRNRGETINFPRLSHDFPRDVSP